MCFGKNITEIKKNALIIVQWSATVDPHDITMTLTLIFHLAKEMLGFFFFPPFHTLFLKNQPVMVIVSWREEYLHVWNICIFGIILYGKVFFFSSIYLFLGKLNSSSISGFWTKYILCIWYYICILCTHIHLWYLYF